MALKDLLKTPPKTRTGYRSKVDVWRDELDEADRKAFDAAVKNPEWTSSALTAVANTEGLEIGDGSFRDWRKRFLRENA